MTPFEIKNLFYISGKPGLFRMKLKLRNGMIVFSGLVDEKDITIDLRKDSVSKIADTIIHKADGTSVQLEAVIERMYELKLEGTVFDGFDKLGDYAKVDVMEKVVPGYDPKKFKLSHMVKVVKWFIEFDKALTILNEGVTDPYDDLKNEEATTQEENEEETI